LSPNQRKEEALKAGMVDYLEKPVSRELMKATIEKFFSPEEKNLARKNGLRNLPVVKNLG
jgi:FixJ family two-component response regulator